jgi:drug/metabolite transporter (DMT)-like permease
MQKDNPRLTRERASFLASHWARELPDGRAELRSDPRHKLPFPTVYRLAEAKAFWRRSPRRCCGSRATPRTSRLGSTRPRGLDGVRERMSAIATRACRDRRRRPHAAPRPARGGRARGRGVPRRAVRLETRRGAYVALSVLTLVWGANWIVMKLALENAHPVPFTAQRVWLAVAILFGVDGGDAHPARAAGDVDGDRRDRPFQTTINFGTTTLALAGGGAGRTSVLVFTMPFWTLVIARIVLGERVRGAQWIAVALAFAGLTLVVAPWDWRGDLAPKLWATLSGLGWAAGSVAMKHFQQRRPTDPLNFLAWQMVVGVLPAHAARARARRPADALERDAGRAAALRRRASTALGFLLWLAILRRCRPARVAQHVRDPAVRARVVDARVRRAADANEWSGIALIGAGLAILAGIAWRSRGAMRAP